MQEGKQIEEVVVEYYKAKLAKGESDSEFNNVKKSFEEFMDSVFDNCSSNSIVVTVGYDDENNTRSVGGTYKITKSVRRTVKFNVGALKKKLKPSIFKKVIVTSWECIDIKGLAAYVKSLGGNFETFKSFFNIAQTVNESELDRLSEVGEIKSSDVNGCYTVNEGKPWYRVTFKAAEGNDE